jgi:hypothetical protein
VISEIEATTRGVRQQLPSFDLAVHLRRGDYVSLGRELSFDYYVRSLASIPDPGKRVVVTSDDELTARTFCEYLSARGYDAHTALDAEESELDSPLRKTDPVLYDFCLISNAKNVIMSNSTFCWWATVVGDSLPEVPNERVVAYPRGWVWFQDDISDGLVQPHWTVVS